MQRQDTGVTIRNPSTANLLIDSIDRTSGTSSEFVINKKYSIMNGYFHRIAVSEVVVDWCIDNISAATDNNVFEVTTGAGTFSVTLGDGSYTVAAALDTLVILLNAVAGIGVTFSLTDAPGTGRKFLHGSAAFTVLDTNLSEQLNIAYGVNSVDHIVNCPVLLPYTYIDFVSTDLTNNQALKDTTTNYIEQNVLYRWYFAWDSPAPADAYGYPIYQGYQRFIARRALPFPKQIRWENNIPIGQLNFQVYSSQGTVLLPSQVQGGEFEWKMTLLVSED
jgi:hypothetical protein